MVGCLFCLLFFLMYPDILISSFFGVLFPVIQLFCGILFNFFPFHTPQHSNLTRIVVVALLFPQKKPPTPFSMRSFLNFNSSKTQYILTYNKPQTSFTISMHYNSLNLLISYKSLPCNNISYITSCKPLPCSNIYYITSCKPLPCSNISYYSSLP